jgi:hypothetical protein
MIRRYALVAENDVFMILSFNEDQEAAAAWIAGLSSSPKVIEISNHPNVNEINRGWTWTEEGFSAPQ